jgi:hypothetical protein
MNEIIREILSHHDAVVALGLSCVTLAGGASVGLYRWVEHRIETSRDEREERQAKDRAEQRHRHRLEKAEKLETVASILIADRSLAEGIRDKIDAEYPRVRVEVAEEEADEDDRQVRRRRSKRR